MNPQSIKPNGVDREWQEIQHRRSFQAAMAEGLSTRSSLRWRSIAAVIALHLVVIAAFLYFNSTIKVPTPPAMPVGVIFDSDAADPGDAPQK